MNKSDLQDELTSLIRGWALEKNILKSGEVIEVTARIFQAPVVTVKVEGYDGPANIDQTLMKNLGLSVRAQNCLSNANLETVGQVRVKTEADMDMFRNFGRKTMKEIKTALEKIGVKVPWNI